MHSLSTEHEHEENLPTEGHNLCRLSYRLFITVRRDMLFSVTIFNYQ